MITQKIALFNLSACLCLMLTSVHAAPVYCGDEAYDAAAASSGAASSGPASSSGSAEDLEIAKLLLSFQERAVAGHEPMAGEASGKRKSKEQGGPGNPKARRQSDDGSAAAGAAAAPASAGAAADLESFGWVKQKAESFGNTHRGVPKQFKLITDAIYHIQNAINTIYPKIELENSRLKGYIEKYIPMHKTHTKLLALFRKKFTVPNKDERNKVQEVTILMLLMHPEINGISQEAGYQTMFADILKNSRALGTLGDKVKRIAKGHKIPCSFKE